MLRLVIRIKKVITPIVPFEWLKAEGSWNVWQKKRTKDEGNWNPFIVSGLRKLITAELRNSYLTNCNECTLRTKGGPLLTSKNDVIKWSWRKKEIGDNDLFEE